MKLLRISQAAAQLNIGPDSLRNYANNGLIPFSLTPKGQRVFRQEDIDAFLGTEKVETVVFYVRSSSGDRVALASQESALKSEFPDPLRVYSDRASGLNENRKGLNRLLDDAASGVFNVVCVTQKDRLTRFGFAYLERHLASLGVRVVVLGEDSLKSPAEELMQDFMSLVASFSGKFYRLRGFAQQRQLLEAAEEELGDKESR